MPLAHPQTPHHHTQTGALQKVPVIPPADELAASALKRSLRVNPGAGIKNEAEKERSRAAKQLDTHMKVRHDGGVWGLVGGLDKNRAVTNGGCVGSLRGCEGGRAGAGWGQQAAGYT